MKPIDFVKEYLPFAKEDESKTGINAIASLAQAAAESGWGEHAPGNALFGIKFNLEDVTDKQLETTFEFSMSAIKTPNEIGLVNIDSIEPTMINGKKFFRYTGKSYFRKYASPADSFNDHSKFFFANSRYAYALEVKSDPYKFIDAIAAAGYAQSPTYAATLKSIAHSIEKIINELQA